MLRPAATVNGYSRYRIRGRVYPAILPTTPSDELAGMVRIRLFESTCVNTTPADRCASKRQVLCGLSEREFEILDGEVISPFTQTFHLSAALTNPLRPELQSMKTKTTFVPKSLL